MLPGQFNSNGHSRSIGLRQLMICGAFAGLVLSSGISRVNFPLVPYLPAVYRRHHQPAQEAQPLSLGQ